MWHYFATKRYGPHIVSTGNLTKEHYFQGSDIAVQDVANHPNYPEHTHEFIELGIVYQGHAINCIDKTKQGINTGDVFVVHPGQTHAYEETHEFHIYNVLFDESSISLHGSDIPHLPGFHALFTLAPKSRQQGELPVPLQLTSAELLHVQTIIEEMLKETDLKESGYRLIARSLLQVLIAKLSRFFSIDTHTSPDKLTRLAGPIAHMEEHFFDPISNAALAELAGLSERSFYRLFKQATGKTPTQHLTFLRLSHVARMLEHTDLSITDIAYECGFQDSSYMSKKFKTEFNLTPKMYRESRRA